MSKIVPVITLAVFGLILVNVLTHVKGTAALAQGVNTIASPAEQAIAGYGTAPN